MLFKVHSDIAEEDDKFFEMNPGALAIEEFNKCTGRQMFFVCLVADRDHDSPLRTLPERARREKAVVIVGYPMEGNRPDKNARNLINGKVEKVEKAIAKYREIQYDEDKEMLFAVSAQIQEAIAAMAADKEALARVTKVTTNKKTEEVTKVEYVDAKMLATLRSEATALGAKLPSLKEAKAKLMEGMNIASPLENVTTYSSQDIVDEEFSDDEGFSTLDMFNEKEKQQDAD